MRRRRNRISNRRKMMRGNRTMKQGKEEYKKERK
jgi:hypothetical protein